MSGPAWLKLGLFVLVLATGACGGEANDVEFDVPLPRDEGGAFDDAGASDEGVADDASGCPTGEVLCDDECVSPDEDPDNCGACGNECAGALHAVGVCDNGRCGLECEAGWSDLDEVAGCEYPCTYVGPNESCNGVDEDCDGRTDEDFPCVAGESTACTTSCGSDGTGLCNAGCSVPSAIECTPPAEACDGEDEDCDTACDNGFPCCLGAVENEGCGLCGTRSRACTAGCVWSGWGSCTGEGVCTEGALETRACTCGGTEARTCSAGCRWGDWSGCPTGECVPGTGGTRPCACGGVETRACSDTCTWGSWSGCATGICTPGVTESRACTCGGTETRTCLATCAWGGWTGCPVGTCLPGASEVRVCACGGTETRTCSAACFWDPWSGCAPGVCLPGTVSSCSNACGVAGWQSCGATCTWGSCCAATETCGNSCDDDCDGVVNDGCPVAPANDWCAAATVISLGAGRATVTGSTAAATDSPGTCSSAPDVWFQYTLTRRELVFIHTYGSSFDTVIGHVDGSCSGAVQFCTDDSCGTTQSELVLITGPGTYYIVVDGFGPSSGSFTLTMEHLPLGSDGSSTMIPVGTTTWTATSGGSSAVRGSCGGDGPEQFFYWTQCPTTVGATVTASTCDASTTFDSVLYLRSGATGTDVACNDDYASCAVLATASRISYSTSSGARLYGIYADGFSSGGSYAVTITR